MVSHAVVASAPTPEKGDSAMGLRLDWPERLNYKERYYLVSRTDSWIQAS